ncbi:Vacuolar protein sorting-associated protein 28 -like protein 2 [Capsicum annuum]|nr:Vacuolar protein sorting-associated protein 28 -like protein 2 [Capsicum annuum]
MESEFVALELDGTEAEWLRNFLKNNPFKKDDLLPHSPLNKDDLLPDIPLKKDDLFSNIPLKKNGLLSNIPLKRDDLMPPAYIHCDCQSAIAIAKNKSYSLNRLLDCSAALNRLVTSGAPATVEHRAAVATSAVSSASVVAECVQNFITAMDCLKLNIVAVDQVHPLLSDLSSFLNKLFILPADFEGKTKMREWLSRLSKMGAADKLTEQKGRRWAYRDVRWFSEEGLSSSNSLPKTVVLRRNLGVQILNRVYRQGCLRVQLRAFWAFRFGNARHGQGPNSGRDELGIKARFMVPGCLRNGCVARHTYKQEATRCLGMSLFLHVLVRAIESECSSLIL